MSRLRVPVVSGLGPGVGAATVAAALHGRDGGSFAPAADVVVCRVGDTSMLAAETLCLAPFGFRPVLAVTEGIPPAWRTRMARLRSRFTGVVELPAVPHWRGVDRSRIAAASLLELDAETLDPAVAAYAEGLHMLVRVLLAGGQLAEPVPPVMLRAAAEQDDDEPAVEPDDERRRAALEAADHPALRRRGRTRGSGPSPPGQGPDTVSRTDAPLPPRSDL